jgi:hypothetical protein
MRLSFKINKIDKLQKAHKENVITFFQLGNLVPKSQKKIQEDFAKNNSCTSKISNKLLKIFVINSEHLKVEPFIQGPLIYAVGKKFETSFSAEKSESSSKGLVGIFLKINDNVYAKKETEFQFAKSNINGNFFMAGKKMSSSSIFTTNINVSC